MNGKISEPFRFSNFDVFSSGISHYPSWTFVGTFWNISHALSTPLMFRFSDFHPVIFFNPLSKLRPVRCWSNNFEIFNFSRSHFTCFIFFFLFLKQVCSMVTMHDVRNRFCLMERLTGLERFRVESQEVDWWPERLLLAKFLIRWWT